jgi:hypothetical protein
MTPSEIIEMLLKIGVLIIEYSKGIHFAIKTKYYLYVVTRCASYYARDIFPEALLIEDSNLLKLTPLYDQGRYASGSQRTEFTLPKFLIPICNVSKPRLIEKIMIFG